MVPAFASGNEEHKDEIWLMLLEKAFAKILGSYAALEQGKVTWALRTLTGDEVLPSVTYGGFSRMSARRQNSTKS